MARIARKKLQGTKQEVQQEIFLVGLYHRLSSEDERDFEQNSLGNQKKICMDYLEREEHVKVVDCYVDNGATGTNFHRPGFERMIQDLQKRRINCIIVKDLSRFGRNYLETSEYLEKIFPASGIRFIAVNNNYDSYKNKGEKEGIAVPFSNIVNEMYARDISGKIQSSIHTLMAKGEYLPSASSIPYGYIRDARRNTYAVDAETESIVRMIFEKRLAGVSGFAISGELNSRGIPSPGRLRFLRGMNHDKRNEASVWSHKTVNSILSNEAYTGCRIYGKVKKEGGRKIRQKKENWQYVHDAHPAIISGETFRKVQELMEKEQETRSRYRQRRAAADFQYQILKDKVFCGDCGSAMGSLKRLQRVTSSLPPEMFYQCNYYTRSGKVFCSNHYIAQKKLLEKIEHAVRLQIQAALDMEMFLKDMRERDSADGFGNRAEKGIRQRQAAHAAKLEQLLIDYNEGVIDKSEYAYIKSRYDATTRQIEAELEEAEAEQARIDSTVSMAERWIEKIKDYMENGKLDRGLVECLIDRVNVYADRSVEIVFTFQDEYREILASLEKHGEESEDDTECGRPYRTEHICVS